MRHNRRWKTYPFAIPNLLQRSNPRWRLSARSMPMNHENKKYPNQKYLAFLRTVFSESFQVLNAWF
jgi:hypothetical protein